MTSKLAYFRLISDNGNKFYGMCSKNDPKVSFMKKITVGTIYGKDKRNFLRAFPNNEAWMITWFRQIGEEV